MKVVMHRPDGSVYVDEQESPLCEAGQVKVRLAFGWVSSGTEGGFLRAMRAKTSEDPKHYHLGYTASGVVMEVGAKVTEFEPGQRVGIYGAPYARHATEVCLGKNLVVPVPDEVPLWAASGVGLGAIALHGLRQVEVGLGDWVVQYGLGPVGLMAVQLADAMGAEVLAVDLSPERVTVLNEILPGRGFLVGEVDLVKLARERTRGRGADAVVLATSGVQAIKDNLAELLRDRGRISLLGGGRMEALNLKGARVKEIEVKFVRAGGPGRYDPVYEVDGIDYPVGYVSWTENRNMETVIRLLARGKLKLGPLVTHCFPLARAPEAWDILVDTPQKTIGMIIEMDPGAHPIPEVRRLDG